MNIQPLYDQFQHASLWGYTFKEFSIFLFMLKTSLESMSRVKSRTTVKKLCIICCLRYHDQTLTHAVKQAAIESCIFILSLTSTGAENDAFLNINDDTVWELKVPRCRQRFLSGYIKKYAFGFHNELGRIFCHFSYPSSCWYSANIDTS